jgi:4a-hydroxytetrahydrobiopterin dehydratase
LVKKLLASVLDQNLALLPAWTANEDRTAISRTWKFKSFWEAFGFMTRVALAAEKADHHPDWCNSYGVVVIRLSTHDAGGLSRKDIALAQQIDALAATY